MVCIDYYYYFLFVFFVVVVFYLLDGECEEKNSKYNVQFNRKIQNESACDVSMRDSEQYILAWYTHTHATDSFRIFNDNALYFSLGRLVHTDHFLFQSIEYTFGTRWCMCGQRFIGIIAA